MEKGNYRDAAASLREVMRVAPSDPEARQLAVELNASQRKVADQALDQMTAARSKAEQWAAGKFASKSFEATLIQESEARALYNARRFEEAAQKFLVTSGLYLGAAEAADSEKAAQDAKTKLADQEKQKAQLFQLADLSRRSYEQEHLDAVREEAETKAADKYQDASRLAAEAQSKWDREDYAGAARSE